MLKNMKIYSFLNVTSFSLADEETVQDAFF